MEDRTESESIRIMPADNDAELSLLGSLLLDSTTVDTVSQIITPEDADRWFSFPNRARLYRHIINQREAGIPFDLVTCNAWLAQHDREHFPDDQRAMILAQLAESVPHALHAEFYASSVRNCGMLRDMISVFTKGIDIAYAGRKAEDSLDECERLMASVSARRTLQQPVELKDSLVSVLEQIDTEQDADERGLYWPWPKLQEITGPLRPGHLVIVAARPSMGKTAFALNLADHAASVADRVLFFSLEMTQQELAVRVICTDARVSSMRYQRRMLSQVECDRLRLAIDGYNRGISIVDYAYTELDVRSIARMKHNRAPIDLIVVDYLQLMERSGKSENRQSEVAAISRRLKRLAIDLNVPIVALSQLNRKPEDRADGRPRLSDLRESGAIEQDADLTLLIHRPAQHARAEGRTPENGTEYKAEIIVAKNRHGPTGTIELHWNGEYTLFTSAAEGYAPSDEAAPLQPQAVQGSISELDEPVPF